MTPSNKWHSMTPPEAGRRLRLLVISHLFAPDTCGGASVFSDMCYGLAQRDIDVTVRCAYPYYPEWKDKSGHNGIRIERSYDKGVQIERYGMFIPCKPASRWQRLLYESSYFLSLCRSLFHKPCFDVVMVFCPLAGSVGFAALLRLLYGKTLWLNVQDLPADAAAASRIVAGERSQRLLQAVQRWLFNRADVWSSISPSMIERLEQLRDRHQPIMFLPNWLHQSIADHIRARPAKVGRLPGRPVRLLYAGNIGAKQGLLQFCKTLSSTTSPFEFQINGDGGAARELREWVASAADSRFSIGPILDEAAFVEALYQTDLFVITEKPASGASFFPSKIVPALASGTPILAVSDADSPLGLEMRSQNVGPWSPWDRHSEITELLASIDTREHEFKIWQQNASQRAQSYCREDCLDYIKMALYKILDRRIDEGSTGVLDAKSATLPMLFQTGDA
jgi:colanic acid biosynthesis glycosyl transferase WcaI